MDIWRDTPRVLIVAPMIIAPGVYHVPRIGQEMGAQCVEKSRQLPSLMKETARETRSWYLDCNPYVQPGEADWMHLSLIHILIQEHPLHRLKSVQGVLFLV